MASWTIVLRTLRVFMIIVLVSKDAFNMAWCQGIQKVYDFKFNFQHTDCSMTINWTRPTYQNEVSRYIVQSAEGCPSTWKNHEALNRNARSMKIEDIALVTSCLQGKCHIRVAAELDHPRGDSEVTRYFSHCVRISPSFYNLTETRSNVSYIGQHACLPIRTACPTLPTFYVGEQMIALQGTEGADDNYYLNKSTDQLCIHHHNSNTNLVVHEVCHFNTLCSLCDENTGEIVLMTRAEIQAINLHNESNSMTIQPEVDSVPSIVMFCPADYTLYINNNQDLVEVCICMPLHEIHCDSHNADGIIMIELNIQDSAVPGEIRNVNPNISSQCFAVEVPMRDIQNMYKSTSLELCMTLLGSAGATRCIHVPEPCVEITVSNKADATTQGGDGNSTLDGTTTNTPRLNDGTIAAIIILSSLTVVILIFAPLLIIVIIFWRKRKQKYDGSQRGD